eukprot:COSAG06_NODE_1602_length_8958_cov_85.920194_5_plen_36_part_00
MIATVWLLVTLTLGIRALCPVSFCQTTIMLVTLRA